MARIPLLGALVAASVCAAASSSTTTTSSSSTTTTLATEYLTVSVSFSPSGTCVSSLAFSLSLAGEPGGASAPFTPNLLAGCPGDTQSGTLLDVSGTLASPSGGTLSPSSNGTYALITGIQVVGTGSSSLVATEDWELSVAGAGLSWSVRRTFAAAGTASSDAFPAIWLTTTTGGYDDDDKDKGKERTAAAGTRGVPASPSSPSSPTARFAPMLNDWRGAVQMPSFASLDGALLDPATGVGYPTASNTRVSVLGDRTAGDSRRILMTPSGVAMHLGLASCRFAMARPQTIFTQHLSVGAECAAGPYSDGYAFQAGDVRENTLTLDFRPAVQGHGFFDLSVPATADNATAAALAQLSIYAQIFQLPMGWINGNSPQCETCIHEISIFPELNGLFRLLAPPTEAPVAGTVVTNTAGAGAGLPRSSSSCPSLSNPFCGFSRSVNTVTLSLECTGGSVITNISAAYGTPSVVWPSGDEPDGLVCTSFAPSATCNDATFQAYAASTCVGKASCTLVRDKTTPDPCPNVEKDIAATVTCGGGSPGSGGRPVPPAGACPSVHDITSTFMTFLLSNAVQPTGYVSPRWDVVGGNDFGASGIIDQMPHLVLAAYHHAVNTNDTATLASWMPTINSVADYMLTTMLVGNTSLLTNVNPEADGTAGHSLADNWLDDVRFGWHDGIVGTYAVMSFRALGDLRTWLGDAEGAASAYATHAKMVSAYNQEYWDDSFGGYSDWIDVEGNRRNYFYVWHQYLAIENGIANATQAQTILARADALNAQARATYNLTEAQLWCTPTNWIQLDPADLTVDFDNEYNWGHYEDGACFQWHHGLESIARARVQGPEVALSRLTTAMTNFAQNRLWGQRYGFLEGGVPLGSDVITDGFYLAYGGLFGALNVRPTLLSGLQVLGPAAPQLEGVNFTFAFQGVDTTVTVENGWARVV
jgi:hypothetical protein